MPSTCTQMDLGLGKLTSIMWIDYFNIIQMALLIAAVVEGLVVHHYFATQRETFAIHLDHVFRVWFPFVVYPFVTMGVVIWGAFHDETPFLLMMLFGIPIAVIVGWYLVKRNYKERARRLKHCIRKINSMTGEEGKQYDAALFELFRAVDIDASGELDSKELRELYKQLYPEAERKTISEAVQISRKFANADGNLDDDSFVDALNAVEERFGKSLRELDQKKASFASSLSTPRFTPRFMRKSESKGPKGPKGSSTCVEVANSAVQSTKPEADPTRYAPVTKDAFQIKISPDSILQKSSSSTSATAQVPSFKPGGVSVGVTSVVAASVTQSSPVPVASDIVNEAQKRRRRHRSSTGGDGQGDSEKSTRKESAIW